MSKYTPGPWATLGVHNVIVPASHAAKGYGASTDPKDDAERFATILASCDVQTRRTTQGERRANARLIAAAPELLEALVKAEDLLAFYEGCAKPEHEGAHPTIRVNGEDFQSLLDEVRSAIAKARGDA